MKDVPRYKLSEITSKYIGMTFSSVSCMELLYKIYHDDLGIDVPSEFEGWSLDDYMTRWRDDRREAERMIFRVLAHFGKLVSVKSLKEWDIVAATRKGEVFIGIYVRRGQLLTSTIRDGVCLIPFNNTCRPVMASRMIGG